MFGGREYFANPGRGIARRYLEVCVEERTDYGRTLAIKEFKDQVVSNGESYRSFVMPADIEANRLASLDPTMRTVEVEQFCS